MPLYQYRCTNCGVIVELRHAIGATPPACQVCAGKLVQVYKSFHFVLKGKGWTKGEHDV